MANISEDAKKILEENGVNSAVIEIMISTFRRPDSIQELAEENFKLREENSKLLYQLDDLKVTTVDFIKEMSIFLKMLSDLNLKDENSIKQFKDIQRKSSELCKVFSFMEMLYS